MDSLLRDIEREGSKIKTDIDNLYRHSEKQQGYIRDYIRQSTTEWARLAIDHPKLLLLIIETTPIIDKYGYVSGEQEPIRLTALAGGKAWDYLVHPTLSCGDVQGFEYHGLVTSDLDNKPRLADVWPDIMNILQDSHIVVFGRDFARDALFRVLPAAAHILDNAFCLHVKCQEYYNEFYGLNLEKVLSYQGINKRRDLLVSSRDRILELVNVIRNLAQGQEKQEQPPEDLGDLEDRPF